MFTRLKIKNFQSLKEVDLELGRITVLAGGSNLGKSAVVRALDCLVHNSYSESYMRKNTSNLYVALYEGEKVVQFNREAKTSSYSTNFMAMLYEKIAGAVPEDIANFLNMRPLQIDDLSTDINFNFQFDGPFLLDSSGFDIGRILGRLIQLESVVGATKDISNDSLSTKREIELTIRNISDNEKYLSDNSFILEQKKDADRLGELLAEYSSLKHQCDSLEKVISAYNQSDSKYSELKAKISIMPSFDKDAFQSLEKIETNINTMVYLYLVRDKIKNLMLGFNLNFVDVSLQQRLDSLLKDLVEKSTSRNSLLGRKNKVESDLTGVLEAFKQYLDNNPICPLTGQHYMEQCLTTLISVGGSK